MSTLTTFVTRLKAPSAQVAVPVLVLLILVMMLVPLPALLLDLLFTFNIGLSILVLIAALNIRSFKDFIAFPTLLLVTTLLRLSLAASRSMTSTVNGASNATPEMNLGSASPTGDGR